LGWRVKFDGHHQFEEINASTDPPIGILKNPRLVSRVTKSVAEVVGEHVVKGELPVTLGGDHSLVSGAILKVSMPLFNNRIGDGNHIWYAKVGLHILKHQSALTMYNL